MVLVVKGPESASRPHDDIEAASTVVALRTPEKLPGVASWAVPVLVARRLRLLCSRF